MEVEQSEKFSLNSGFKLVSTSSFGFAEFIWTLHKEKEDIGEDAAGAS